MSAPQGPTSGGVLLKAPATKDDEREAVLHMFADMIEMLMAFAPITPENMTPETRALMQLWANWRNAGSPC